MRRLFKSDFFWKFAGGFAFGAVGLFALHPAQAEMVQDALTHAVR